MIAVEDETGITCSLSPAVLVESRKRRLVREVLRNVESTIESLLHSNRPPACFRKANRRIAVRDPIEEQPSRSGTYPLWHMTGDPFVPAVLARCSPITPATVWIDVNWIGPTKYCRNQSYFYHRRHRYRPAFWLVGDKAMIPVDLDSANVV